MSDKQEIFNGKGLEHTTAIVLFDVEDESKLYLAGSGSGFWLLDQLNNRLCNESSCN